MRQLTKKQKKMLDKWYSEQIIKGQTFGIGWRVEDDNNFDGDLYQKIDEINPCEIFNQNVNRYINDKIFQ